MYTSISAALSTTRSRCQPTQQRTTGFADRMAVPSTRSSQMKVASTFVQRPLYTSTRKLRTYPGKKMNIKPACRRGCEGGLHSQGLVLRETELTSEMLFSRDVPKHLCRTIIMAMVMSGRSIVMWNDTSYDQLKRQDGVTKSTSKLTWHKGADMHSKRTATGKTCATYKCDCAMKPIHLAGPRHL